MAVGRSCFSGARKFAEYETVRNLGPESTSVIIDFNSNSVSKPRADLAALCWAHCCLWIQRAKADKRIAASDPMAADTCSAEVGTRLTSPAGSRALILALDGNQTDMGMTLVLLLSKVAIKTYLDAYAAQGGSFVMLTLNRSGWAHAIAIKLNRSSAELNSSSAHPCAIFDPNVGQGMYVSHEDLAADLLCLIQAYGMVSSIRAQVVGDQVTHN